MIPNRDADVVKRYQLTNLLNNNNKWYTLRWWKNEEIVEITYGRVGQACVRPAIKENITQKKFDKLCADREKPKEEGQYKEIKTGVQQIITSDTAGLSTDLVKRITTIFQAANENIATYLNTSISDLAPEQIAQGKLQLAKLQQTFVNFETNKHYTKNKYIDELIEQARIYYEYIPSKLPAKINALNVALNLAKNLSDEEDKLLQLEAAVSSYKVSTGGGSLLDQLGCKLTPVSSNEFRFVEKYFNDTKKHNEYKHLNVKEVWSVEIPQERENFNACGIGNIKLLWHGTNPKNVKHILHKKGLIIPNYAANGSLFSRGIYLADVCTKSIHYAGYDKEKYLFLADARLGKQYYTRTLLNSPSEVPKEYNSVFAEAGVPIRGVYAGSLKFSEYVLYKPEQQTIKYLVVIE